VTTVDLTATARSDFGKGAARRMRRDGNIPAVIYGQGMELVHIAIPNHDLDLALRKPRVVLSINFDGATVLTKPRDIQRDPVKRTLEHVDLVVITEREARVRSAMAQAIGAAAAAAEEAGIDVGSVVQALEEAVAAGEDPEEALQHAVADAERQAAAYAEAARHEAEVEAAAEETAEVAEGETVIEDATDSE
jgi:large subunit ribosomal protein L25